MANARQPHSEPPELVPDGFDFSRHIRAVCSDMVTRLPEMSHVDMGRVAVSFSQARKGGRYGVYASLTPMRFADGALVEQRRRGQWYTVQRLRDKAGQEILYILCFCLPRFMDTGFQEKLTTIVHELWHISPAFDGDIRRHEGRCYAHSRSQQQYDAQMAQMAERWLQLGPPPSIYAFLKHPFRDLERIYGRVYGTRVSRPKLIPISADRVVEIQQRNSSGSTGVS